jgi:Na+/H+-dicarboxylate symporter
VNPLRWKLHWQIAAALALSVAAGAAARAAGPEAGWAAGLLATCDFLGTLFLNALKMLVVPLIAASIISGMTGLGADRHFGRLGLKTVAYYLFTGLAAIVGGLFVVNLIGPGRVSPEVAGALLSQAPDAGSIEAAVEGRSGADFVGIFLRMFPPNVIDAATHNGQLLGVIVFCLLFGFFIARLPEKLLEAQRGFWDGACRVMMSIADLVIRFAPVGVFGLVTPQVAGAGLDLIGPVAWFFLTVLVALGLHFLVTQALVLRFLGQVDPRRHYRAMAPVLATAFSTASSVSTLPLTLEATEKEAGVSHRVSSFTLPLGATVNMDGTALYECVVVIFIGQLYGALDPSFSLGLAEQFTVVLLALLTSVGVAGIPSASLVAIAVIMGVVGLPLEYLGIVLVVDRVLDMCRTAVNVFGDSVGAVVIARSEGEDAFYPGAQG